MIHEHAKGAVHYTASKQPRLFGYYHSEPWEILNQYVDIVVVMDTEYKKISHGEKKVLGFS